LRIFVIHFPISLKIIKPKKKHNLAQVSFDEGFKLLKKQPIPFLEAEYYIEQAELYFITNEVQKAVDLSQKGLEIAKKIQYAEYIEKGEKLLKKL
jgi:hypothetical protein